jgi:hypothetical protein
MIYESFRLKEIHYYMSSAVITILKAFNWCWTGLLMWTFVTRQIKLKWIKLSAHLPQWNQQKGDTPLSFHIYQRRYDYGDDTNDHSRIEQVLTILSLLLQANADVNIPNDVSIRYHFNIFVTACIWLGRKQCTAFVMSLWLFCASSSAPTTKSIERLCS